MTLALTFGNAWLLLGLAAAAIPVVLHLLSSVRAPEMTFPTLRFLKISMEKTARRRRLEHWLLLLIRSLLLAALALAVAEPIVRAAGGFWAERRFAAVLVVDNSYSMAARSGGASRFERAHRQAQALLDGPQKPTSGALLLTNGPSGQAAVAADLGRLREDLARAHLASGRAAVAERIARAAELLADHAAGQRAVYVFTDLQAVSFRDLPSMPELKRAGIPLMLVDCSGGAVRNVGLAELRVAGRRIVGQNMSFFATLVNSSEVDQVVDVSLQVDGRRSGQTARQVLSAAGRPGDRATVRFFHTFTSAGPHAGFVALAAPDDDALSVDNVRRFSLEIADRVEAVLVRGSLPAEAPGAGGPTFDAGGILQMALDPFQGGSEPWSIRLRTILAAQLNAAALADAQLVVLADVPALLPAQAQALEAFVRRGGSAVVFLAPDTNVANYNDLLVQRVKDYGGLLPGRIGPAVGQVGPAAEAVTAVRDLAHPYLADLYQTSTEYPEVLVQRYYRLGGAAAIERVLWAPSGDPIVSAKRFADGRVVLFATTADRQWNNLATTALLLPMLERIALEAGEALGGDQTFPAGAAVTIRPRAKLPPRAAVNVKVPDGSVELLPLKGDGAAPGVLFTKTDALGVYEWQVAGATPETPGAAGTFATNMDGAECDLASVRAESVVGTVAPADVYVGDSVEAVHARAAKAAGGENWWDRLVAVAIVLLVLEAVVANRFRRGTEPVPAHVNPRIAA